MKYRKWKHKIIDQDAAGACARALGISSLLSFILWARGLHTAQEMQAFLDTSPTQLENPLDMKDMEQGARRLAQAIAQREYVAVYGDYDVDGITATALMADYLKSHGLTVEVYIPDRLGEGYGLNPDALQALKNLGVSLVVTVDCGITATEEVQFAKDLGMDVVITDHHQCPAVLPEAVAVINPHRLDCAYPYKELSGVGVAFALICAIEGPDRQAAMLDRYADLVACGTVADVMELSGQNRILVAHGTQCLRQGARVGFDCLIKEAKLEQKTLDATGIGYFLAPRLNAAGRMGNAKLAYSLLDTEVYHEAQHFAQELCHLNQKRQEVEANILEEALGLLAQQGYTEGPIILACDKWHQGVLGVVSARLMERFLAPVLLLAQEGDTLRGSCRSVLGFDLFSGLKACSQYLERFGGHEQAAGISLAAKNLPGFIEAFRAYYEENLPRGEQGAFQADFLLDDPRLITLDQIKSLSRLEPCGKGNPSPTLLIQGASLVKVTPIGGGKHVKLLVSKWGQTFDCVFFSMSAENLGAKAGDEIDLLASPQCNHFRGKTTVQFLVRDLALRQVRALETAREAFDFIRAKQPLPQDIQGDFYPPRQVLAGLWRRLSQDRAKHSGRVEQLLETLLEDLRGFCFGQAYFGLWVFEELKLITMEEQEGVLSISICPTVEKVDLQRSKLLKTLEERQG